MLQMKGNEVDALLARLTEVTKRMGDALANAGSEGRSHTLARHRDILHDFGQEYRRLSSIAGAAKDRAELLGGGDSAGRGGSDATLMSGGSAGLLLRERGMLDRSNFALDGVLNQAQSVAGNLTQQRNIFDAVNSKVLALGAKYPVVNSLLNAVRRRKNRDSIILAAVAGTCLLLILIYWARK
jgi:golgi SNAP receptor complex member 1